MGIQAVFKFQELRAAGAKLAVQNLDPIWVEEEPEYIPRCVGYIQNVVVTFPDGEVIGLSPSGERRDYTLDTLPEKGWVDFNHWGSNRARMTPILEKYGIEWQEV